MGYEQGSVREILVKIVLSSRHHQTSKITLEMSSMDVHYLSSLPKLAGLE